jgi:hypothetical protein
MTPTPTSHGTTIKRKGNHPLIMTVLDDDPRSAVEEEALLELDMAPSPHFAITRLHAPQ